MFKVNENYLKLPGSYLFSNIAKKVAAFTEANPELMRWARQKPSTAMRPTWDMSS